MKQSQERILVTHGSSHRGCRYPGDLPRHRAGQPRAGSETLRIRANPAHHTHPAAQPHPSPEQPPSRRPTAAGARRGPVGSRSPGAQWMDLRLRRRSSRAGRGDLNRADRSFRGHRRSTRHVPETALTAAPAVPQRQRQARCRPTRSESTRRTPRANAAGLRVWGGGLRGSRPARCGRDVDDGPAIAKIAPSAFLSGPPQIHVQGRAGRVRNALAAGQPAPGGRLAGVPAAVRPARSLAHA